MALIQIATLATPRTGLVQGIAGTAGPVWAWKTPLQSCRSPRGGVPMVCPYTCRKVKWTKLLMVALSIPPKPHGALRASRTGLALILLQARSNTQAVKSSMEFAFFREFLVIFEINVNLLKKSELINKSTGSEMLCGSAEFRIFSRIFGHLWDQCKSADNRWLKFK